MLCDRIAGLALSVVPAGVGVAPLLDLHAVTDASDCGAGAGQGREIGAPGEHEAEERERRDCPQGGQVVDRADWFHQGGPIRVTMVIRR